MSSATDLTKFKGKHVSDLPPGASGYELKSAEETLNEFADSGLTITSSKDWVETLPQTFAFPEHSNPLDFLKVKDQQQVGACFPAGTMVTLADGRLIAIEDVTFGNFVRTHLGNARQVIDTMSRKLSLIHI